MSEACSVCTGRGVVSRYVDGTWVEFICGRCQGSRQEPVTTLRELRELNQERIRREAAARDGGGDAAA